MTKRYFALICLCIAMVMGACKKDHTPEPSGKTDNPYARTDNAGNEADHQIYLVYKATGIPVLYSDTLRKSPLVLLNPAYQITSFDSTLSLKYLTRQADIISGVAFINQQVIPALGGGLKPFSILMTDSAKGRVVLTINGVRQIVSLIYSGYPSRNTLIISKIPAIASMSADTLNYYKKDIFKPVLQLALSQQQALLNDFGQVSLAYYGKYAYGTTQNTSYVPYAPMEVYGLVSLSPTPAVFYSIGSQADDVSNYLDVVLTLTKSQFAAKYGNYPLVMTKYDLFVKALTALGFKMPL